MRMAMYARLMPMGHYEAEIIRALRKTDLTLSTATAAVMIATQLGARPRAELVEILATYPGLGNQSTADDAIEQLSSLGWIEEAEADGLLLMRQVADLRTRISHRLCNPDVADQLQGVRASHNHTARIVGAMYDEDVFDSFLDLLRSAQHEVRLPMLATAPYAATVGILRDIASRGVRVRCLLGSPQAVGSIRGGEMRSVSERRIEEWRTALRGLDTAAIRITDDVDDLALATCVSVDGRVLRVDVYDHLKQRSLQGVLAEFRSPAGFKLNVQLLFDRLFEEAWAKATPAGRLGTSRRWLRLYSQYLTAAALAVAGLIVAGSSPAVSGFCMGLASALYSEAIFRSRRLRSWWARWT
jgi:hypothetical protein